MAELRSFASTFAATFNSGGEEVCHSNCTLHARPGLCNVIFSATCSGQAKICVKGFIPGATKQADEKILLQKACLKQCTCKFKDQSKTIIVPVTCLLNNKQQNRRVTQKLYSKSCQARHPLLAIFKSPLLLCPTNS